MSLYGVTAAFTVDSPYLAEERMAKIQLRKTKKRDILLFKLVAKCSRCKKQIRPYYFSYIQLIVTSM